MGRVRECTIVALSASYAVYNDIPVIAHCIQRGDNDITSIHSMHPMFGLRQHLGQYKVACMNFVEIRVRFVLGYITGVYNHLVD